MISRFQVNAMPQYNHFEILSADAGVMHNFNLSTGRLHIYNFGYNNYTSIRFPHTHPFHELKFFLQGSCTIRVGESISHLASDDLIYIPPETEHFIAETEEVTEYVSVAFDFDFFSKKNRKEFDPISGVPEFQNDEYEVISNLMNGPCRVAHDTCGCRDEIVSMCRVLSRVYLADLVKLISYQINFFISACQNFHKTKKRPDFEEVAQKNQRNVSVSTLQIQQYIWNNCVSDLTLEKVAEEMHYSSRTIQRYLLEYYNVQFSTLLANFRVMKLKEELEKGTSTLESFSQRCGYANSQSLSRLFREVTGMSVAQYKQMLRAKMEDASRTEADPLNEQEG